MSKKFLEHQIDEFLYTSPFPWWEWNIKENIVKASPRKVEMLGYRDENFKDKGYQAYTDLLHKDDYERTMKAMRDLLEGKASIYQVDYRIIAADKSYHWYMDRGTIISRLSGGTPEKIRGIVIDLGANIEPAASLERLLSLFRKAVPSDRTSRSLLTVCSSCRRIRSGNKWIKISRPLSEFITMTKSHGLCEDCLRELYPQMASEILNTIDNKR